MCDPLTAMVGLGVAGVSLWGQSEAADAQQAASDANIASARRNAALALQKGAATAYALGIKGRKVQGTAMASYGASGLSMGGSPAEAMLMGQRDLELDQLNTLLASGNQADSYNRSAELIGMEADAAQTASMFKMAGTIFGVGQQIAGAWNPGMSGLGVGFDPGLNSPGGDLANTFY